MHLIFLFDLNSSTNIFEDPLLIDFINYFHANNISYVECWEYLLNLLYDINISFKKVKEFRSDLVKMLDKFKVIPVDEEHKQLGFLIAHTIGLKSNQTQKFPYSHVIILAQLYTFLVYKIYCNVKIDNRFKYIEQLVSLFFDSFRLIDVIACIVNDNIPTYLLDIIYDSLTIYLFTTKSSDYLYVITLNNEIDSIRNQYELYIEYPSTDEYLLKYLERFSFKEDQILDVIDTSNLNFNEILQLGLNNFKSIENLPIAILEILFDMIEGEANINDYRFFDELDEDEKQEIKKEYAIKEKIKSLVNEANQPNDRTKSNSSVNISMDVTDYYVDILYQKSRRFDAVLKNHDFNIDDYKMNFNLYKPEVYNYTENLYGAMNLHDIFSQLNNDNNCVDLTFILLGYFKSVEKALYSLYDWLVSDSNYIKHNEFTSTYSKKIDTSEIDWTKNVNLSEIRRLLSNYIFKDLSHVIDISYDMNQKFFRRVDEWRKIDRNSKVHQSNVLDMNEVDRIVDNSLDILSDIVTLYIYFSKNLPHLD